MPIKFNVIEKGQPGAVGGGIKKYYANTVRTGEMTLDELTTGIEKISTVSGSDIRAVLYAMVYASIDALSNSKIVRLGDLGSLMINVKSEGRNTLKGITSSAIKGPNIIFKPDRRIKKMQATVKFQKDRKISSAYEKSISCLEILNTTHDNNFFTRDILFFTHGFARREGRGVWKGR